MSTDLQKITDNLIVAGFGVLDGHLPVFTSSAWEDHVQAWIDAESEVTTHRWRQAAICASISVHFGEQSIKRFAESVGVHERRIYEYRAAYQLATQFAERPPNLDFTHWIVASAAPDPVAVIEEAAETSLSVRGLKKLIAERTAPPTSSTLPAIADNPQVAAAWQQFRTACHTLSHIAPITATAINYALEEVQYALEIPEQTVAERIIHCIGELGLTELDPIAQTLGEHRDRVRVWLSRMVEGGQLTSRRQEIDERAPGARGPARVYYSIAG